MQTANRSIVALAVPTTLLFVASAAFAAWILWSAAERLNQVSFNGERQLALSAVKAGNARLEKLVGDYAFWDEMNDQFEKKFDAQWAKENLGQYAIDEFDVDAVLVVDGEGKVYYNYGVDDQTLPLNEADKVELINVARTTLGHWTLGKPSAMTGVVTLSGAHYLASAAPITVNSEQRLKTVRPPHLVLIYIEKLGPWVQNISKTFGLANTELTAGGHGAASIPDAFHAKSPVDVTWRPAALGELFLKDTLPLTLATLGFAVLVFLTATFAWSRVERKLKEALRAAQAANEAKSEFLALMSHEIRTPMNGVLGMTNVLLEAAPTGEQRRGLITIRESGESLMRIINDVLDFSKLDAGRMAIETAAFDFHNMLRYAIEICLPRAKAKSIALDLDIAPEVPLFVRGDAGRIRQVVLNLVSNAVKFTATGGVSVRVTAVCEGGTAHTRVTVSDTGIGIEAESAANLFNSFAQANASISRRFGGTGLGLAISKKLIERMGGTIGVESQPGQGSTFWFELPLSLADESDAKMRDAQADLGAIAAATSAIEGLGRPVRLLLVEDNATNQLVATSMLRKFGINPDIAGNGIEAVDAARRQIFDLILMDMHMPEMDGIDATRAIRSLSGPNARVPIIALTANAFDSDVERCLASGMNGHIAKPFSREQLIVAIADALNGKRSHSSEAPKAAAFDVVLDQNYLEAFRAENGEALLQILIETYVNDSVKRLERLRILLATDAASEETVRIAHTLKSASAMAGAPSLSAAAAQLEKTLKTGGAPVSTADADALSTEFNAYRAALAARGLAPAA